MFRNYHLLNEKQVNFAFECVHTETISVWHYFDFRKASNEKPFQRELVYTGFCGGVLKKIS